MADRLVMLEWFRLGVYMAIFSFIPSDNCYFSLPKFTACGTKLYALLYGKAISRYMWATWTFW